MDASQKSNMPILDRKLLIMHLNGAKQLMVFNVQGAAIAEGLNVVRDRNLPWTNDEVPRESRLCAGNPLHPIVEA
jgi:hypothetical protein